MAKKQFIRHLEFYGFPDQNGYSSEINGVDLSDIREKNKEQDEEIQDLEGEKADKKDLVALSGTVENFITRQSEINQEFADAISGMSGDIEELKAIDTEFAEQLSAITSGVDEAMDAIEILGDRIEDVEDSVSGLSGAIESITEDYAKKEDVYSKEEIDEMISSGFSGYATQEWVEEQGYITEEEADAKYANIEDLEALSGAVESAATDIDDRLEEINDSIDDVNDKADNLAEGLSAFSEDVASAFSEVNDAIDEINDKISGITDDIADLVEVVSGNTEAIENLNEAVSANTEAIEELDDKIDDAVSALTEDIQEVKDELDNKANVSDLEDLHTEMINGLENLENKKAEKEDLNFVSGAVDAVDAKIDAEIARSTSADTAMQNKIDELDAEVQEAVETVESYGDRIDQIESGLAQEIIDRQNGDTALIGTSGDSDSADTIWGAKNLADMYKGQAIASAKTYTDDKFAEFDGELQNLEDRIEQQMSQFATEEFVISACNDTEAELRGELGTALNNEIERAERAETNMEVEIQALSAQVVTNIGKISDNASRINALTRWEGTNPEEYDSWASSHPDANGIVDVLHREVHSLTPQGFDELKAQVSANTADIAANTEAIATKASTEYVNSEIERVEEEIPSVENLATKDELNEAVNGKADADSVYTKEEVDELLAAKNTEIEEIQAAYNNLKNMVLDLYYATTYSIPADSTLDSMLKSKSGEAKLTEDITTGTIAPGTTAKNIVKLNLGGKTVTFTGATTNNPAMMFINKQQVYIGVSGTIYAVGRLAVEANGTDCEITLSGTMFGRPTYITDRSGGELIYCYLGTINITDGIFKNTGEDKTYLLNCYDANYKNGTAKIVVTGGKFYDFNPADNTAEGPGTSFVPAGYHVETSTDGDSTVYTVKKD
ncbi:MAG: hypothetical protein J6O49_12315 [Bacteroidaceae bacterium]|nr:hypothetical protein [Bacteroidaceae bacterium]